jgi:uncharacterized protein YjbI with pentapeptide repeats
MRLARPALWVVVCLGAFCSPLYAADEESLKKLQELLPKKTDKAEDRALNLSGVDMRSYDLCSSDKHSKLDFRGANLKDANFSGMKICNVDFEGADLEGANFEKTTIKSCNFRNTSGPANFTRASIKWSGFNDSVLGKSVFKDAKLESVGFDFADLTGANFDGSTLFQVNFYSANLTGYSHNGAHMDRTNFERSKGTSWFE